MFASKPQFTVFDIAKDLCLEIVYVHDLPENCGGFLEPGPEPRFIVVNAKHSHSEQVATIAHELGHYALHHDNKTKLQSHWLMTLPLGKFGRQMRRATSRFITREDEADLWGICLLLVLGAKKELIDLVSAHPEKLKCFCLAMLGSYISNLSKMPYIWLKVFFGVHITR